MTNLLLLNIFLSSDIVPTRSNEKESDELLCTVRSLVMVRNQLPTQEVNSLRLGNKYRYK